MKIKEVKSKSVITKSSLPEADFVINPYVGCSHGCKYCYASFMKKFTGHMNDDWGDFVDFKSNASELIPKNLDKYKGKSLVIGSVTDPYQLIEKEYRITRSILGKLVDIEAEVQILTKSDLIVRDIDILKEFKNLQVAISLTSLNREIVKNFEKNSVEPFERIEALKKLSENNIYTILFISPILPYLTDWREIIEKTKDFVDEFWFENLNLYSSAKKNLSLVLKNNYPELSNKFFEVYSRDNVHWNREEREIRKYCLKNNIKFKIYFHHKNKSNT